MTEPVTIWEKVNYGLVEAESTTADSEGKAPTLGKSWKRTRFLLDSLGTLFWIYVILKVFVFDVDREAVSALAPGQQWLVDYRLLFFLGIAALVVVLVKPGRALLGGLYVLLFPLVVVTWKVPKLLYKSKSWVALFAALHVIASVFANFKYVVVATATGAFSVVFILFSDIDALLVLAMITLGVLLLVAVLRTLKFSARPASFIAYQEKALARWQKTSELPATASVDAELRDAQITKFNEEQQQKFLTNLQSAVLVQRLPLFWAYQLDQYRRSPVPVLFTGLAYAWLVLQAAGILTLINYALYKLDAASFLYSAPPSIVVFARYAISSLIGNEIGPLQPQSDLANGIFLGATILGIVFLIGFVIGLILSYRQKSQDAALLDMIDGFKAQSRELDELLQREYDVKSVDEALARLEELRGGLIGVLSFLSSRIPPGFSN